jgi:hypothetical protein
MLYFFSFFYIKYCINVYKRYKYVVSIYGGGGVLVVIA